MQNRWSRTERGRKSAVCLCKRFAGHEKDGKTLNSKGTFFQFVSRELLNPTNPSARSSMRDVRHQKGLKTKLPTISWSLSTPSHPLLMALHKDALRCVCGIHWATAPWKKPGLWLLHAAPDTSLHLACSCLFRVYHIPIFNWEVSHLYFQHMTQYYWLPNNLYG